MKYTKVSELRKQNQKKDDPGGFTALLTLGIILLMGGPLFLLMLIPNILGLLGML